MARLKSASGLDLVIKADLEGNGHKVPICSINSARGINFNTTFGESLDIDCEDPGAVAFILREPTSQDVSVSGGGTFDTPNGQYLFDWWRSGEARAVDVVVDVSAVDGGIVYSGDFVMTWNLKGDRGQKIQAEISLMSTGEVTMSATA